MPILSSPGAHAAMPNEPSLLPPHLLVGRPVWKSASSNFHVTLFNLTFPLTSLFPPSTLRHPQRMYVHSAPCRTHVSNVPTPPSYVRLFRSLSYARHLCIYVANVHTSLLLLRCTHVSGVRTSLSTSTSTCILGITPKVSTGFHCCRIASLVVGLLLVLLAYFSLLIADQFIAHL